MYKTTKALAAAADRGIYVNALGQTSLVPRDGYTLATSSVPECDASPDAYPLSHYVTFEAVALLDVDEDGNILCAECGADHGIAAYRRPWCSQR